MALYLGSVKRSIYIEGGKATLIIPTSTTPTLSGVMLKTLDNYILKDSNGLYLTTKESE